MPLLVPEIRTDVVRLAGAGATGATSSGRGSGRREITASALIFQIGRTLKRIPLEPVPDKMAQAGQESHDGEEHPEPFGEEDRLGIAEPHRNDAVAGDPGRRADVAADNGLMETIATTPASGPDGEH